MEFGVNIYSVFQMNLNDFAGFTETLHANHGG